MCTVTFCPHREGFVLGMNRDEQRSRPEGCPPRRFTCGESGRQAIGPHEPGHGMWIGANDAGMALALLNWYAASAASPAPASPVSRGSVIPALLPGENLRELEDQWASLPLGSMRPFRLVAVSAPARELEEWRWDGGRLFRHRHPWAIWHWFSSGLDEPSANRERARASAAAARKPCPGSTRWLRQLHASHGAARGPFSICMHRPDAVTVSYTEVVMRRHRLHLLYRPGAPCESRPGSAVGLDLG